MTQNQHFRNADNNFSVLLLSAGFGTRLKPFTDIWPKCLMPIDGKPLLEHWLENIKPLLPIKTIVNTHFKQDIVNLFLTQPKYKDWVLEAYEEQLLGTAATLRNNTTLNGENLDVLLIHADNYCTASLDKFIDFHFNHRPEGCSISMMTFDTENPKSCGIVECDQTGVVKAFYEKVDNPPGNKANGAIYLLSQEVIRFIHLHPTISDFSTEVLPRFVGQIATWQCDGELIDIGTPRALFSVSHKQPESVSNNNEWEAYYSSHSIHGLIADAIETRRCT